MSNLQSYKIQDHMALRQEGNVYSHAGACGPHSVRSEMCWSAEVHMELLAEFTASRSPNYKHGTPDGVEHSKGPKL